MKTWRMEEETMVLLPKENKWTGDSITAAPKEAEKWSKEYYTGVPLKWWLPLLRHKFIKNRTPLYADGNQDAFRSSSW